MRSYYWSFAVNCILLCAVGRAEVQLSDVTTARFASVEQGRSMLTKRDDFVQGLSAFDRAARMKTDRAVSEAKFLKFVAKNVLSWTEAEQQKVESALNNVRVRLKTLPVPLPAVIYLVKTSGAEEGGAAYTRDCAVVIPQAKLSDGVTALEGLICHELFHVLSRTNPELRESLYEMIGFHKCNELEFPADLKSRKITNPDAPRNNHFIHLKLDGKEIIAIPILFSRTEKI